MAEWCIPFWSLWPWHCCGGSKELSQWDGSFEHPKHMFKLLDKKVIIVNIILHQKMFANLDLWLKGDNFLFSAVPYSPTTINVLELIDNKVTLTWTPPADDGGSEVTKYHVFIKDNNSSWKKIGCVPSSQTKYETGELTVGSYYFAVCAENSEGCSDNVETLAPTVVEDAAGMFFLWPSIRAR